MRLPGTRYQEHGWEQVRKLLGHCSLQVWRQGDPAALLDPAQDAATLDWYTDSVAAALQRQVRSARAEAPGNSYGESAAELALSLVFELQANPAFWQGLLAAVRGEHARLGAFWQEAGADAILRKKVNDMFSSLRDRVDADNCQASTGRACSANKMYAYRMLDTSYHAIDTLFAAWRTHQRQVGAILGRTLAGEPIETRQMRSIADCRPEWLLRWSATLAQFSGAPGPLHTRSKRFASLKDNPARIGAMLAEIGEYEALSSNQDHAESWQGEAGEAALWLEDYWRVIGESESAQQRDGDRADEDRILAPQIDDVGGDDDDGAAVQEASREALTAHEQAREQAAAREVCLPPRFAEVARGAQDGASWAARALEGDTLAIRLAVYQKLLGGVDDSYPDAWCDPATGALPTLQQLAALDGISIPTLRKRRNQAIARLQAANSGTVR